MRKWPPLLALISMLAIVAHSGGQTVEQKPGADDWRFAPLVAAASADHLWIIDEDDDEPGAWMLLHHAADMDGPFIRSLQQLAMRPVKLAAWDDRLWLAYPPRADRPDSAIEVFTVRVRQNPMGPMYYTEPLDRLESLEPLPGNSELIDFAGSPDGPIALIRQGTSGGASGESAGQISLLKLGRAGWESITTPPEISLDGAGLLCASGVNGETINVLMRSPRDSDEETAAAQLARYLDERWQVTRFEGEANATLADTVALISIGGDLVAISHVSGATDLGLGYILPGSFVPLTRIERPEGAWVICGMRHEAVLIERSEDGSLAMRRIGAPSGEISERKTLTTPPTDAMTVLRLPLLLAITLFAIGLVVYLRPRAKTVVQLPDGAALMPLIARMTALLIDLFPAGVLAVLIYDVRPAMLLRLPLITLNLEDSLPYLMMVTLTMLHVTATELFGKPSLGKAMLGGKLVQVEGGAPSIRSVLLRGGMKFVTLLVPPLGVVAFMNPNLQSLHDMVAQTLVVRDPDDPDEPGTPEDTGSSPER